MQNPGFDQALVPLTTHQNLTRYAPLPLSLLAADLSSHAKLLYAVLLSRGTLSQKNGWADETTGQVYVIYPVAHLAQTMGKSVSTVKRALQELEGFGLIRRVPSVVTRANRIYLFLPAQSGKDLPLDWLDEGDWREDFPQEAQDVPVPDFSTPFSTDSSQGVISDPLPAQDLAPTGAEVPFPWG